MRYWNNKKWNGGRRAASGGRVGKSDDGTHTRTADPRRSFLSLSLSSPMGRSERTAAERESRDKNCFGWMHFRTFIAFCNWFSVVENRRSMQVVFSVSQYTLKHRLWIRPQPGLPVLGPCCRRNLHVPRRTPLKSQSSKRCYLMRLLRLHALIPVVLSSFQHRWTTIRVRDLLPGQRRPDLCVFGTDCGRKSLFFLT